MCCTLQTHRSQIFLLFILLISYLNHIENHNSVAQVKLKLNVI